MYIPPEKQPITRFVDASVTIRTDVCRVESRQRSLTGYRAATIV